MLRGSYTGVICTEEGHVLDATDFDYQSCRFLNELYARYEDGYHEKHRLCYYDAANCPFKDHDSTRQKHAAPPAAVATTDQELFEGVEGVDMR